MSKGEAAVFAAPRTRAQASLRVIGALLAWCGYVFLLAPSLVVIPISFSGSSELEFPPRTLSLALYVHFFTDRAWWGAALQSVIVGLLTALLSLGVALPAAYALARSSFRGKQVVEVLLISPMLVPVIVLGLGLYMQYQAIHMVDTTLGTVIAHAVLVTPFAFVSIAAGLRHTDPALETVATLMGAGRMRIMASVVLPQIAAPVAVGALFAFLISFDEVVVAYFLTGASTQTLPVKMYTAIRWEVSPVLAAVSTLLTLTSLLFCLGIMALQNKSAADSRPATAS
jgi:putative spermidine/putrescine transport system permease protein